MDIVLSFDLFSIHRPYNEGNCPTERTFVGEWAILIWGLSSITHLYNYVVFVSLLFLGIYCPLLNINTQRFLIDLKFFLTSNYFHNLDNFK